MNIKDFLIDNYVYIIIVIILIIVTIIGFLADKKKNSEGSANAPKNNNPNAGAQPVMNQPISYQPVNNGLAASPVSIMPQVNNLNPAPNPLPANNGMTYTPQPPQMEINQNLSPVNNGMPINTNINTVMEPPQMNPTPMSIPQPVEPMNQNVNVSPEPMYQPLSEQKPTFTSNQQSVPIMPVDAASQIAAEPVAINFNQNMAPTMNMSSAPSGPVMPTPMPNPTESTMPSPMTPPQPVTPQPVNFVYNQPQQGTNNNPYMQQ